MQDRHFNRLQYFNEQVYTTQKYVIPYIEQVKNINGDTTVLEIGCGEGGNMKPFLDLGCSVTGIDLSANKIEHGREFFKTHFNKDKLIFICDDIYNRADLGKFDIVFLRDVIEHLPNQDRFMDFMKNFIHQNSLVFFGFPPWQNPFGGHQQMCHSKLLSKFPFFHLLPKGIYKAVLKTFGEGEGAIKALLEIKETGISLERFERILKKHSYKIERKTLFLINPNYEIKFKLKPRNQNRIISQLRWLRNFVTSAAYYVVSNNRL